MRTPTRITTIVTAGILATAGTAAAAGQGDRTCSGTGAGTGPRAAQGAGPNAGAHNGDGRRSQSARQRARRQRRALPARTTTAPLSAAEGSAVTYMREEEKLARDVYRKLAVTSGNATFTRIAASEQRHMDAMGRLIQRYRLTDPAKGMAAGEFRNAELQRLYDELIAKGSASPTAALEVGRNIEQLDIADLQAREAQSRHADVQWVFERLERGSENHLRAFTTQLS
jgi:hypothetical protein